MPDTAKRLNLEGQPAIKTVLDSGDLLVAALSEYEDWLNGKRTAQELLEGKVLIEATPPMPEYRYWAKDDKVVSTERKKMLMLLNGIETYLAMVASGDIEDPPLNEVEVYELFNTGHGADFRTKIG